VADNYAPCNNRSNTCIYVNICYGTFSCPIQEQYAPLCNAAGVIKKRVVRKQSSYIQIEQQQVRYLADTQDPPDEWQHPELTTDMSDRSQSLNDLRRWSQLMYCKSQDNNNSYRLL